MYPTDFQVGEIDNTHVCRPVQWRLVLGSLGLFGMMINEAESAAANVLAISKVLLLQRTDIVESRHLQGPVSKQPSPW
jgi:hypothetical protein